MDLVDAIARTVARHRALERLLEAQDGPAAKVETGFRREE